MGKPVAADPVLIDSAGSHGTVTRLHQTRLPSMKLAITVFGPRLLVAIFASLFCGLGHAQEIKITQAEGSAFFTLNSEAATDFSGLTWVNGEDYFAVSDKDRAVYPLRLQV